MADLTPEADAAFRYARDNASFATDSNGAHALIAALTGLAHEVAALREALPEPEPAQ